MTDSQWEDKASGYLISDAVNDLHKKTSVWSTMYYGTIEVREGVAHITYFDGPVTSCFGKISVP